MVFLVALSLGSAVALALAYNRLPDVATLEQYIPSQGSELFDRRGRRISKIGENRIVVPLSQVPKHVQQAVISAEDGNFYRHGGIDPVGILRAAWITVSSGGKSRVGGSTITQQLALNLYLQRDLAIGRKLIEALLAIRIEQHYKKDKILELYLNQVYWGHGVSGVEAASRLYFGKSVSQLSMAEGALMAGLLRAPEYISPYRRPELAQKIQGDVLRLMAKNQFVSLADAEKAAKQQLRLPGLASAYPAPYFTDHVLMTLTEKYGEKAVREGGLKVHTTLDLDLQFAAEAAVRNRLKGRPQLEGALVSIDPSNGEIRAMVGGKDYRASQFNRAILALRQPASTFKPIVYLTAFAQGVSPGTYVDDSPVTFGSGKNAYKPQNNDRRFRGPMSIRAALEGSINVVAVKVIHQIGTRPVIDQARSLGIRRDLKDELSLALGSSEVTPLEMASVYATFAAEGKWIEPHAVLKVVDSSGHVLEEARPQSHWAADPENVRLLSQVLKGVVAHGTGRAAGIGRPVAGKTGTSSGGRDGWFCGYTPQLATVVWVGRDDSKSVQGLYGGVVAAPIWRDFMSYALRDQPVADFTPPANVVEVLVDARTGQRASQGQTKGVRREWFLAGHEPPGEQTEAVPSPGESALVEVTEPVVEDPEPVLQPPLD